MTTNGATLECPHCGARLRAFRIPEEAGWGTLPQWVCFNDECSYFRDGWTWMWDNYRARASYRYRIVDVATGSTSPLAVWSETALRDRILDDPSTASDPSSSADDDAHTPR